MSSFKLKKIDPLFSTPLCLFEIDNSADLNKKLISESRAWRKQEKGANVSNQGDSWHSPHGLMMREDQTAKGWVTICVVVVFHEKGTGNWRLSRVHSCMERCYTRRKGDLLLWAFFTSLRRG